MGIPKAIALSLAGHLFCLSTFCFQFDRVDTSAPEKKISVAFLGSWLGKNEISPQRGSASLNLSGLSYAQGRVPRSKKAVHSKPLRAPSEVSSAKHWNKFLVAEETGGGSNETAEDRYLAAKPAWERVSLKLKIE